jgi:ankyrin repeat protein
MDIIKAVNTNNLELVNKFIKEGKNVDLQDNNGWTALIWASWNGLTQCADALIKVGANINLQSKGGWTALMHASKWGHTPCVDLLIKAGANVNLQNNSGDTALVLASYHGRTPIIKKLVKAGANINYLQNNNSWTFFMYKKYKKMLYIKFILYLLNDYYTLKCHYYVLNNKMLCHNLIREFSLYLQ